MSLSETLTTVHLERDSRCWMFSIAFGASTHSSEDYVELRWRMYTGVWIEKLQVLAIPIYVCRAGKMLNSVVNLLHGVV